MANLNHVKLGFIPLLDCAPLVVARELGYFRQQGLDVTLCKTASWSSIRDKVSYGLYQGAQMLAPMPLATTIGLGAQPIAMETPLTLSRNGNAISCSTALFEQLRQHCDGLSDPIHMALALKELLPTLPRRPIFATVYPYSNHYYQLRNWLCDAGINPDTDVDMVAIAPSRMLSALSNTEVDGCCVGEPWSSLAVLQGYGLIVATGQQLWPEVPEKVFAVCSDWAAANPETYTQLTKALLQACQWISNNQDNPDLLQMLALPPYLDRVLQPLLSAGYHNHWGQAPLYQQFAEPLSNRPSCDHGAWLLHQMLLARQVPMVAQAHANPLLSQIYRSDLFDLAASQLKSVA